MTRSPKTGQELDAETGPAIDRRTFLLVYGGMGAAAATGLGYAALTAGPDHETVEDAVDAVNATSYLDGTASSEELGDGTYEAVLQLEDVDLDVVQDGEAAVNALAAELGQQGHYLFGEDNDLLTDMQPFYDHLGRYNATRRDDDQQVSQYTVRVTGLEDTVAYTASAAEMRAMEVGDDGDALAYEVADEAYWEAFLENVEPA